MSSVLVSLNFRQNLKPEHDFSFLCLTKIKTLSLADSVYKIYINLFKTTCQHGGCEGRSNGDLDNGENTPLA